MKSRSLIYCVYVFEHQISQIHYITSQLNVWMNVAVSECDGGIGWQTIYETRKRMWKPSHRYRLPHKYESRSEVAFEHKYTNAKCHDNFYSYCRIFTFSIKFKWLTLTQFNSIRFELIRLGIYEPLSFSLKKPFPFIFGFSFYFYILKKQQLRNVVTSSEKNWRKPAWSQWVKTSLKFCHYCNNVCLLFCVCLAFVFTIDSGTTLNPMEHFILYSMDTIYNVL